MKIIYDGIGDLADQLEALGWVGEDYDEWTTDASNAMDEELHEWDEKHNIELEEYEDV